MASYSYFLPFDSITIYYRWYKFIVLLVYLESQNVNFISLPNSQQLKGPELKQYEATIPKSFMSSSINIYSYIHLDYYYDMTIMICYIQYATWILVIGKLCCYTKNVMCT